jgi:hypothetical protein
LDPRDDDIEFDFFEEEPSTAEAAVPGRSRMPGRGGRGGGRRASTHPPRGVMPLVRLLAFIAIIIAVLVVFGLMLQSCSSTSKHDAYQRYLEKVATIAHSSTQDGVQVATVLTTPGLKATDLYTKLSSIAEAERQNATAAAALDPPGRLRPENQQIVEALDLRVSGTQGLADTFKATAASTATSDATLLVAQADRMLASDVIWDDLFLEPTKQELVAQGVSGVVPPESHYVANTDLITATSMAGVLKRLRGASTGGTVTGLHGTNVGKTVAEPGDKTLSESVSNTVVGSTGTAFLVTVHDGGDSQEVSIRVTLTIQKDGGGGGAITQTKKIAVIDAGGDKTVKFSNLGALPFAQKTHVNVDVSAVPGEKDTSNNHASYPVLFSLG